MDSKKLGEKFNKLIVENLPEDKLIEFEIMIEINDKKRLNTFIRTILPDIENIISENLEKLK